ncbi:O-antigen polymerase [Desulfosporosinus lacus]|uniref:Oligosaccharide repeat unit polymerase n=1 Tax=Desulfosporosinus lacus DSM 15449 TaxID=1121420 RepID=A0A1M5SM11_9FIRM|nr:O-antigen polymerase [Desulfosporosinus lacus]SHH38943.1 oligosaccharide repeat unit polymerase [Desulfosporosinus lacus DSM 15449]
MSFITIFVHVLIIIIGVVTYIYDYKRSKKNKIKIFTGINLIFIFIYGIVPLILNSNKFFKGKTDFYLIYTVDIPNEPYFFASIIIIIGYISLLLGYFFSKPYCIAYKTINVSTSKLKLLGVFILLISCLSTLMVASDLGGFFSSIQYIDALRSGNGEVSVSTFGFMLLPVAIPAFLIFLSFQIKQLRILSLDFLFLLIAFFNSMYYVLMFGGRLPFALFVLVFILYYLDKKNAFNIKSLLIIGVMGFLLLNYLGPLFEVLSDKENVMTRSVFDNIPRLVAQFSFPYINTLKVHSFTYEIGEFRYFIDLISWIYNNFIPNKVMDLFNLDLIPPSYVVNSANHLTTGIPTDIITFGYYQFSLVGVIIVSFLFGKIVGWFDRFFNTPHQNVFLKLTQIRMFEILAFYPMYADIEAFMRRRIDLTIMIIIIIVFAKKFKQTPEIICGSK